MHPTQINRNLIASLSAIFVLSWVVPGCSRPNATADSSPTNAPAAPRKESSLSSAVVEGERYTVKFHTAPEPPKVGNVDFQVDLEEKGKPYAGAKVSLTCSMPEMKMPGPVFDLDDRKGGKYGGKADLTMGGKYEVQVDVQGAAGKQTATFYFEARQ